MASSRGKMPRAERAKQFSRFAALKGLEEALKEKERVVVDRIELSEETGEALSYKLNQVERGMTVTVIYYSDGEYVSVEGRVTGVDTVFKVLTVVKTQIPFSDIYDIRGEQIEEYDMPF